MNREGRLHFFLLKSSFLRSSFRLLWISVPSFSTRLQPPLVFFSFLRKLIPWDFASDSNLEEIIEILNGWRKTACRGPPATPQSQRRAHKKPRFSHLNVQTQRLHELLPLLSQFSCPSVRLNTFELRSTTGILIIIYWL